MRKELCTALIVRKPRCASLRLPTDDVQVIHATTWRPTRILAVIKLYVDRSALTVRYYFYGDNVSRLSSAIVVENDLVVCISLKLLNQPMLNRTYRPVLTLGLLRNINIRPIKGSQPLNRKRL